MRRGFLAPLVLLVPFTAIACGEVAEPPAAEPEVVFRSKAAIRALFGEPSHVVVVHDDGIDRVDANDGSIAHLAGVEYRACPESNAGARAILESPANVAISGNRVFLSDAKCGAALWTRDIATNDPPRELAPSAAAGDWPGTGPRSLSLTIHHGRVIAPVGSNGTVEIWSFGPADGLRERLGTLPDRITGCDAAVADDEAFYVGCRGTSLEDRVFRLSFATREVEVVAPVASMIAALTQDEDAVYVGTFLGSVERLDKAAPWTGRTSPAKRIDWPAFSVVSLAADKGTLIGVGLFARRGTMGSGVWSVSRDVPAREIASFEHPSQSGSVITPASLVLTERAAFAAVFRAHTEEWTVVRVAR
jgi:hypothetical protein